MTLQEFENLSFQEKLHVVKTCGEFADSYKTRTDLVKCYSVNKFFVEIFYSLKKNSVVDIHGFVNGISLDKYVINFNNCNNQF
jgi:hypothetical protein